jgi:hypothetical protein
VPHFPFFLPLVPFVPLLVQLLPLGSAVGLRIMAKTAEEDIFIVAVWIIYVLTGCWFGLLFWSRHQRFKTKAERQGPAKTILHRQVVTLLCPSCARLRHGASQAG